MQTNQLVFNCQRALVYGWCLNHFYRAEKLTDHKKRCRDHRACKAEASKAGSGESAVKFKHFSALLKCSFVIDFECLTIEVGEDPNVHLSINFFSITHSLQLWLAHCMYFK